MTSRQSDRYDDLDVEFNNLLNEMSTGERREPAMQANASIHRQPAYVEQRPTRQQMPTGQAPTEHAYRDDRYDTISDQDFERAMAAFEAKAEDEDDDQDFGPPMTPIAEKRPRRGLWVAALVGGSCADRRHQRCRPVLWQQQRGRGSR
jgi:hypothetical protein